MKLSRTTLILITLLLSPLGAGAPTPSRLPPNPSRRLFDAIRACETGTGYSKTIGPGANGPYQIQRGYWRDSCEYGKVDWKYDPGVLDVERCEQVMTWYWARYKAKDDNERITLHRCGCGVMSYIRRVTALAGEPK